MTFFSKFLVLAVSLFEYGLAGHIYQWDIEMNYNNAGKIYHIVEREAKNDFCLVLKKNMNFF